VDALGKRKSVIYTPNPDGSEVTVEKRPPSGFEPTWQPDVTDTYDPQGRIIRRVTRPSSSDSPLVEAWTYDARFFRTSATRSGGETVRPKGTPTTDLSDFPSPNRYGLDPTSLIRQTLDGAVGADRVTRDAFGRITSYVVPAEDLPGASEAQRTVHVRYDREDRPRFLDAVDPTTGQSTTTEFRYDPVGNLVDLLAPRGQTAHFTYDARDSLVEARISAGLTVRYAYDDQDDLQRIVTIPSKGAKEVAADYAYDGLHRLRRIVRYPNWPDTIRADVLEYAYDSAGRPSAFVSTRP
jgi:YD repeat-containing protein